MKRSKRLELTEHVKECVRLSNLPTGDIDINTLLTRYYGMGGHAYAAERILTEECQEKCKKGTCEQRKP